MGCSGSKSVDIPVARQEQPQEEPTTTHPNYEDPLPQAANELVSSSGQEQKVADCYHATADYSQEKYGHANDASGRSFLGNDDNTTTWESTGMAALVKPSTGFVIKTKRKQDESKVFINIFHHQFVAPIASSAAKHSADKGGLECTAYDVVVNSQVYALCMEDDVVHHQVCLQAIEHINIQYSESLNAAAYKLPRIKRGFIGDYVHDMPVPAAAYSNPDKSALVPYTPPDIPSAAAAVAYEKKNNLESAEVFGLDPAEITVVDHTAAASTPHINLSNTAPDRKA